MFERKKTHTTFRKKASDGDYNIGKVAIVLMIFVFIYLTFMISNYSGVESISEEMVSHSEVAISLALVGLSIGFIIAASKKRVNIELNPIDESELMNILFPVAVGTALISIMNFILFKSIGGVDYNISGYNVVLFNISMAIVEEIAFSFLFQIAFEYLLDSDIGGIIVRGIAFAIYHYAVYGGEWIKIISVLLTGIILATTLRITKRLSTNMLIHVLINLLASGFAFGGG